MKDVIIIGGGASGIVCAIMLAKKGKNVLLIEKQDRIGKKILATGNGRCNLTNVSDYSNAYNCNVEEYLKNFSCQNTINFFNSIGLLTYADEEGRVYPVSNTATSVLDVLRLQTEVLNIQIKTQEEVVFVKKEGQTITVQTNVASYACKNVVFAMGGKSVEPLFNDLKVKIVQPKPALCSLKTNKLGSLNGVRQSNVLLKCGNFSEYGEILFKDSAISGIVVFNLSFYLAKNNISQADAVIDLLPNYTFAELEGILNLRNRQKGFLANNFLMGIFHKELSKAVLLQAGVNMQENSTLLSSAQIKQIVSKIKNFNVKITGFCDNNQIFTGGIDISELNNNLQLKKYPNFYATGEALNVYGKCGGYNLQWAFCSASIVAGAI